MPNNCKWIKSRNSGKGLDVLLLLQLKKVHVKIYERETEGNAQKKCSGKCFDFYCFASIKKRISRQSNFFGIDPNVRMFVHDHIYCLNNFTKSMKKQSALFGRSSIYSRTKTSKTNSSLHYEYILFAKQIMSFCSFTSLQSIELVAALSNDVWNISKKRALY